MSEIDDVRGLLTGKPRPVGWPDRRARIEEVCAVDPPAEDVVFTPTEIAGVSGEWSLAPGSDASRVLIYLHGGGYCSGSIKSHRSMVGELGRAAGVRTLALAYRLAPEHPFPAALEDSLGVFRALREEGFAPRRLAIGGDSAGGGLTLATLLSLRAAGEELPAAALLLSPWVDLTMNGASMADKDAVDPLIHRDYLDGLAGAYAGAADRTGPLVSPLFADLSGMPPVLTQVGASETLLDDAVRITRTLGAQNVPARLSVWPDMIHAFPIWWRRLSSGRAAIAEAGAFLQAELG